MTMDRKPIAEVDTKDNLKIRKVKETDLPALKKLIMPGFKAARVKFVQSFSKSWMFLMTIVSTSLGFTTYLYGEYSLWIFVLIYTTEFSVVVLGVHLVFYIGLEIMTQDLRHWKTLCDKYIGGFWVAEGKNGEVVGSYALAKPDDPKTKPGPAIELQRMAVSPDVRRRGIGMKLLHHAFDNAKALGYKSVFLCTSETQTAAIALYDKAGFETDQVLDGWVNVHVMHKPL